MIELRPKASQVGIAVRWKNSADAPPKSFGHIDIILPGGEPIGFYTTPNGVAGVASRNVGAPRGISDLAGLVRATGFVWDFALIAARRPEYVDMASARANGCKTTVVIINTTPTAGTVVSAFWSTVGSEKDAVYNLWGGNCASYALVSLAAAGILDDETIVERFTDTPESAFQKVRALKTAEKPISGYASFIPEAGDQFRVSIDNS